MNGRTGEILVEHRYTADDGGLVISSDLVEDQAMGTAIQAVSHLRRGPVRPRLGDEPGMAIRPILGFQETPRFTHVAIRRPVISPGHASQR